MMFDGSLVSLAHDYRVDKRSGYHRLPYARRTRYDNLIEQIIADCANEGVKTVEMLDAEAVRRVHDEWVRREKVTTVSEMLLVLRNLMHFGALVLYHDDCEWAMLALHKLKAAKVTADT